MLHTVTFRLCNNFSGTPFFCKAFLGQRQKTIKIARTALFKTPYRLTFYIVRGAVVNMPIAVEVMVSRVDDKILKLQHYERLTMTLLSIFAFILLINIKSFICISYSKVF